MAFFHSEPAVKLSGAATLICTQMTDCAAFWTGKVCDLFLSILVSYVYVYRFASLCMLRCLYMSEISICICKYLFGSDLTAVMIAKISCGRSSGMKLQDKYSVPLNNCDYWVVIIRLYKYNYLLLLFPAFL